VKDSQIDRKVEVETRGERYIHDVCPSRNVFSIPQDEVVKLNIVRGMERSI